MPSPTKNEGMPRKTVKMEPPSDPNENCPQNPQQSKKQQKQPPTPMAPSAEVFRVKVERIFETDAASSFNGPSTSSAPEQQIQLRNVPIQLNLNGHQYCAPDPNAFVRDDTQSDRCSDEASASGHGSPSPSPPQLQIADEMDGGEEDMEIASENGDDENCAFGNGQSAPSDDNDFRPESAAQNAQRAVESAAEDSDHDFRHEMAEEERRTGMAFEEYAENEAAESSQNGGGPSCSTAADPLMVSIYEDGPNPDQMQLSPQELWQRQNQRQSLETLPESEKQLEAQKNGRESTNSSSPKRNVKIPLEGSDGQTDPRNGRQVQNQLDSPMDVPLPNWAPTRATSIDNDRSAPTPARFSPPTNVNNNIGRELATQRHSDGSRAATKSHDDGNPAASERGKQQHGSGSNLTPGCPHPLQQMPIPFQPPPPPPPPTALFGLQQQPMFGVGAPHPQMPHLQNHIAMQQRQFFGVPMVPVPTNNHMPMANFVPPMPLFPNPPPNVSKPAPANIQQQPKQPFAAPLHEHPAITAILGQPTAPSKSQHPSAEASKKQNPASSTSQKKPNKASPPTAAEKHQLPWLGGKPNPTPPANSKQLQQRKDAPESSANEQRQKEKHPSGQSKANKPVDMQLVEENKILKKENAQLKLANDLLKKMEPEMADLRTYKERFNNLSDKVKTMKSLKDFNEAVEVYKKAKEEAEKKCRDKEVLLRSKQSRIEQLDGVGNDNKKLEIDLKKTRDDLKMEKEKFANFRNSIAKEYIKKEKEWKDEAKANEQKIKEEMRKEGEEEKKKRDELKKEVDQMKEKARKEEEQRGKLAEQLKKEQAKVEEANKMVEKMKKKKAKRKRETEELMERMKAEIKEETEAKAKRELETAQQRLAEEHRNKIAEIEQKNREDVQMLKESGDGVREMLTMYQERFKIVEQHQQQRINMTPSSRQSSVFPEGDVAENSQQQQFMVERPKRSMQMDGTEEEGTKRRRINNSPSQSTSSASNNHNSTNSEEQLGGSPNLLPQQNSQIVQPSADEADDDDEILIIESPSQTQASSGGGTQQHRPVSRTKSMADSDVSSRYQGLPTPNDEIAAADEENKKQQQLRQKFAQELGLPIDHHQIELKMQEHFYNIQKEQMRAFEHGGRAVQTIHQHEQPEETSPPSLVPSPAIDCPPPAYSQHSTIPPSFQQQQMQTASNFALGSGTTRTAISAQNLTAGLQQQQQQFGAHPTPQQQLSLINQFLATPQGQQQQHFPSISAVPPVNVQHQQQLYTQFAATFQMEQQQATPQMPPNVLTSSSAPLLHQKKKRAPRKQPMNSSSDGNGQQPPHQFQQRIPITSRFADNLDYLARFGINQQGTGCQAPLPNQQLQTAEMLQVRHSQMQSTSMQGSTPVSNIFGAAMMAGGNGSGNSGIEQSSQSNYPAAAGNGSGSSSASSTPATMSPNTEAMKMAKKMIGNFSKFFQRHPTPTSPPESLVDEFLKIVNKSPMGKKSKNLGFDLDILVRDQLIILATRLVEACKRSSPSSSP